MIVALRSLLFYAGLVVLTISYGSICVFTLLLPYPQRYQVLGTWAALVGWWLKLTCGITHRVEGMEHLPDTPSVILCNHQAGWETIMFQRIFPTQTWVMKRELMWIPFFGWTLGSLHPIVINRKRPREAAEQLMAQGLQALSAGRWVIIYPEGTRIAVGETRKFAKGGATLAKRAGCAVVPVAHNSGLYWVNGNRLKRRAGVITVRVGPPIDTTNKTVAEINALAEQWIDDNKRELCGLPERQGETCQK